MIISESAKLYSDILTIVAKFNYILNLLFVIKGSRFHPNTGFHRSLWNRNGSPSEGESYIPSHSADKSNVPPISP